jgi:hypothetical protein
MSIPELVMQYTNYFNYQVLSSEPISSFIDDLYGHFHGEVDGNLQDNVLKNVLRKKLTKV